MLTFDQLCFLTDLVEEKRNTSDDPTHFIAHIYDALAHQRDFMEPQPPNKTQDPKGGKSHV